MSDTHDSAQHSGRPEDFLDDPEMLGEDDLASDDDSLEMGGGDRLAAAKAEIADLKDRFLRLAAELDNTRRRAEREKADAARYAISNFARDVIGIVDNFERALRVAAVSTPAEGPNEGPAAGMGELAKSLIDGLKMTEKEVLSVLERHGVRRVAAEREKFDPNVHQAVAQVPHAEIPSGHVVDVAQQGFTIGDRVLRAAMVTVSSGPGAGSGEASERLDIEV